MVDEHVDEFIAKASNERAFVNELDKVFLRDLRTIMLCASEVRRNQYSCDFVVHDRPDVCPMNNLVSFD